MNERIKQFAEQAEFSKNELHIQGDNFQRFAELIVRECIEKSLEEQIDPDLIDQEQDIEDRCYLRGTNSGIIYAVCAIEKHFGVEE